MDRKIEKSLSARAVELGKSGKAEAVPELVGLAKSSSCNVRRLATSALGKLAGIANSADVVPVLSGLLRDPHPQVRQYAIKALSSYGADSATALHDLHDISANPSEKEYNRADSVRSIAIISEARRIREEQASHKCQKCRLSINSDEYARSMKAFQRIYCDKCFDEVFLKRRNFDTEVELNKTIIAKDGTLVQSDGERIISDFLNSSSIEFRYDERIRIIDGFAIRPDFYLPEFDVYIEYWGMDTADYKIGMLKKQKLYQQEGKKLISLHFSEKSRLAETLGKKLRRYMVAD